MGKYSCLIDSLYVDGKYQQGAYGALVGADGRAFRPLVKALLGHPNGDIRESCAEILRDRMSAMALPYLVEALVDPVTFVRDDAFWAIEAILRIQPGGLGDWLDVSPCCDEPETVRAAVEEFLLLNKEHIANL